MGETSNPLESESLYKGYSGRMFILLAIGVLGANLGRQAIPPLLPNIIEDLAISPAAAGFAITVMHIAFAVFQYPSGRVADELSRKSAIIFGLGTIVIGFIFITQSYTYYFLLASTFIIGVGSAFFYVSERILLSDLFVAKRGQAFGLSGSIGRIGSIAAAGLAIVGVAIGSWHTTFVPVVILLIVTLLLFHFASEESYKFRLISLNPRKSVGRVFGKSRTRTLVIAYTLVIFSWEGIIAFLPVFLQSDKGFSAVLASVGFATLFAAGILVQPLSGVLSDRLGRHSVATITTLISILGLSVVISSTQRFIIWFGIFLYAAGTMGFTPVMQAYLLDIFPDDNKGGDLGIFKTVYEGLSSLGPTYVGAVGGYISYSASFSGFILLLSFSSILLFYLGRFNTGS